MSMIKKNSFIIRNLHMNYSRSLTDMVSKELKKRILGKRQLLSKSQISKPKSQKKKSQKLSKSDSKPTSKVIESGNLKWKSVEIPDTLDDFGGLYGLEEIDGVGVEYVDGKVQFVVKDQNKIKKDDEEENQDTIGESDEENLLKNEDTTISNTEESPADDTIVETKGSESQGLNFADVKLPKSKLDLQQWSDIKLSPYILQGLSKLGYNKPTPIQKKCIPKCLDGEDVIGKASTGSGKTLAYGIPILEKVVANPDSKSPAGIIFTPTRELAHQVVEHLTNISQYFPFTQFSILGLTGGLSIHKQQRLLKYQGSGQIIVATPGRFLEHIEKDNTLAKRLGDLDILVLDEADRLLQDGHFDEFEQILKVLKSSRTKSGQWQSLVFSATFGKDLFSKLSNQTYRAKKGNQEEDEYKVITDLLNSKLHFKSQPAFIDLNPNGKLSSDITEALVECLPAERDLFLYYFLLMYPGTTLVFTNAIDSVKRLVPFLNNLNISTFAIHSNMIQKQRLKNIEKFKEASQKSTNKSTVLIASDVAARGLDISGIQHVVHYHLPRSADVYIHRSGRTARSGNEGVSVMICSPQEASGPLRNLRKALSDDKSKFKGKSSKKWSKDVQRLSIESDILSQLRQRVHLASDLADNDVSTKSLSKEDNWMQKAADDLGIELSDMEEDVFVKRNRSKKENKKLEKNDVASKRRELSHLLNQTIRKDLRRSYLTGGLQNLADSIVKGVGHGNIIGHDKVDALDQLRTKNKAKKGTKV